MFGRAKPEPTGTRILAQTADSAFEQMLRTTFGANGRIEVAVLSGTLAEQERKLDANATVLLVDVDPKREADFAALARLTQRLAGTPPLLVVIPEFDQEVARQLIHMRISDFLVKPVAPLDLVRTCARLAQGPKHEHTEARIYTFLPAAGGVGLTTLAIETAMLLRSNAGERASTAVADRGAEPPGRDALVRLRGGDAPARPGGDAFR
jgi:pilus assembly protein CpaE